MARAISQFETVITVPFGDLPPTDIPQQARLRTNVLISEHISPQVSSQGAVQFRIKIDLSGVSALDGPAVLRPYQHEKLARGAQDKEHAMSQKI
ncbi:hypothetical protein, partial [Bradyrhizobium sp. sGM-13]|uniref:hypothetical protein n=1 Tax=Bradyrhizobium sp. sGM-13 TaxID=2831781 RepID=UPI001BCD02A9